MKHKYLSLFIRLLLGIGVMLGLQYFFSVYKTLPVTTQLSGAKPIQSSAVVADIQATDVAVSSSGSTFERLPNADACIQADLAGLALVHRQQQFLYAQVQTEGETVERWMNHYGMPLDTFRRIAFGGDFSQVSTLLTESHRLAGIVSGHNTQVTGRQSARSVVNTVSEHQHRLQLIDAQDYQGIGGLLKDAPLQQKVGQLDLLSTIFLRHPALSIGELQQFLDVGVMPTLASLTYLSRHPQRIQMLSLLLNHSPDLPIHALWLQGNFTYNLLLDALKKGDISGAQFWYQRGVTPAPNTLKKGDLALNALDVFPELTHVADQTMALTLLADLISDLGSPLDITHRARVEAWITEGQALGVTIGALQPIEPLNEVDTVKAQTLYQAYQQLLEGHQPFTQAQYDACLAYDAFYAYRESYGQQETEHLSLSPEEWLDKLSYIPSGFSTLGSVITGEQGGLQQVYDWLGINAHDPISHSLSLLRALEEDKSYAEIKSLLEAGTEFSDDVIFTIASRARGDVLELFVVRGLNVHVKDADGRNALYYALLSPKPAKMFSYLYKRYQLNLADSDELLATLITFSPFKPNIANILYWAIDTQQLSVQPYHLALFYRHIPITSPQYDRLKALLTSRLNA